MEKDKPESGASRGILGRIRMRFGEVAKRLGLVSSSDVENALVKQESEKFQRRIGEVLVDDEKITTGHVEKVLKVQKDWEIGAEALPVKATASKPAKASTKKPAKKTAKKKTAKKTVKKKTAARKPAKKKVSKKTARASTKKPAKKTAKKKTARAAAKKRPKRSK